MQGMQGMQGIMVKTRLCMEFTFAISGRGWPGWQVVGCMRALCTLEIAGNAGNNGHCQTR